MSTIAGRFTERVERMKKRAQLGSMLVRFANEGAKVQLERLLGVGEARRRPTWSRRFEALVKLLRGDTGKLIGVSFPEIRARMRTPPGGRILGTVHREAAHLAGVAAEITTPKDVSTKTTVLYLHGGGYCVGAPRAYRDLAARLATSLRARVVTLDYRLAPEHPYPAGLDDACAAYRALLAQGVDPKNVLIGGDSAGGGLTLATLLRLRDEKSPLPAGGILISPWLDLGAALPSIRSNAGFDWIDEAFLTRCAEAYRGALPITDPRLRSLDADLHGLPPLLVQVGDAELLLDDAMTLDERARASGVDVTLERWPDQVHVFQIFAEVVPDGARAIERIARFGERVLGASAQDSAP